MLQGVVKNYGIDVYELGVATIKRFSISEDEARDYNMRTVMSYGSGLQFVQAGDYVKLYVNGELMMSDTPMEKKTNMEFIRNAHGEVMIAGLGIGLILENLIPLYEDGKVTKVVVYEKYQDVIDLVAHRYTGRLPLEVRCEDIMTYKPSREEKYDTLYFDIWPEVDDKNLDDVCVLHNRWKTHKKDGAWMSSWMADYLRKRRAAERRSSSWW